MNNFTIFSKLKHLVAKKDFYNEKIDIADIQWRLEALNPGDLLFYCLGNHESSNTNFIEKLKQSKLLPALIITDFDIDLSLFEISHLVLKCSDHFLLAQKILMDEFYPLTGKMKLVGITGTNGKTTTASLGRQVAKLMGKRSSSIGTLGVIDYKESVRSLPFKMTTPPYIELRKNLFYLEEEHDVCFLEVSSHALVQQRVFEFKFDVGAWMSFSQDHLDYHMTMDNYFNSKLLLIQNYLIEDGICYIPAEERWLRSQLIKYATKPASSINYNSISHLPSFLTCSYNKNNLEVAISLNEALWNETFSFNLIEHLKAPKGRFQVIEKYNRTVIVDSAHTPDALDNLLKSAMDCYPEKNLNVVFGCGGDRDAAKRPIMGEVVAKYAHKIYITSDNPRSEVPETIINQISQGIKNKDKVNLVISRARAIELAIMELDDSSVLIIAGKGHEDYQLIKDQILPFSDIDFSKKILDQVCDKEVYLS